MKKFLATIANWGLPLLLVLSFLCGTAYLASLKPAPKPTKPSREPKPPLTAEDAGGSRPPPRSFCPTERLLKRRIVLDAPGLFFVEASEALPIARFAQSGLEAGERRSVRGVRSPSRAPGGGGLGRPRQQHRPLHHQASGNGAHLQRREAAQRLRERGVRATALHLRQQGEGTGVFARGEGTAERRANGVVRACGDM